MSWLKFGTDLGDDVGFGRPGGFSSTPGPDAWASTPGFMTSRPQVGAGPEPAVAVPPAPPAQPNVAEDFVKIFAFSSQTPKAATAGDALAPLAILLAVGIGAAAIGGRKISGDYGDET